MRLRLFFTLALIVLAFLPSSALMADQQEAGTRNYFAPMSIQEQRDIRFIILTLATKSKLSLLFHKSALSEAGNRIDHVHPLRLLGYIFSDHEMKNAVKKIHGMPWNSFVKGMGESLARSARSLEIKEEYVMDFSQTVGIDESAILPLVRQGDWREFVNGIRSQLP